jgi:hypothetical protein
MTLCAHENEKETSAAASSTKTTGAVAAITMTMTGDIRAAAAVMTTMIVDGTAIAEATPRRLAEDGKRAAVNGTTMMTGVPIAATTTMTGT